MTQQWWASSATTQPTERKWTSSLSGVTTQTCHWMSRWRRSLLNSGGSTWYILHLRFMTMPWNQWEAPLPLSRGHTTASSLHFPHNFLQRHHREHPDQQPLSLVWQLLPLGSEVPPESGEDGRDNHQNPPLPSIEDPHRTQCFSRATKTVRASTPPTMDCFTLCPLGNSTAACSARLHSSLKQYAYAGLMIVNLLNTHTGRDIYSAPIKSYLPKCCYIFWPMFHHSSTGLSISPVSSLHYCFKFTLLFTVTLCIQEIIRWWSVLMTTFGHWEVSKYVWFFVKMQRVRGHEADWTVLPMWPTFEFTQEEEGGLMRLPDRLTICDRSTQEGCSYQVWLRSLTNTTDIYCFSVLIVTMSLVQPALTSSTPHWGLSSWCGWPPRSPPPPGWWWHWPGCCWAGAHCPAPRCSPACSRGCCSRSMAAVWS